MIHHPFSDLDDATRSRFAELSDLADGWDSYGAKPVAALAVLHAANFLWRVGPDCIRFSIYPVPKYDDACLSGIQVEACVDGMDLEFEFDSAGLVEGCFLDRDGSWYSWEPERA